MSDQDRLKRLEVAFERLCDLVGRVENHGIGFGMIRPVATEIELLKQYVRGDLEPQ